MKADWKLPGDDVKRAAYYVSFGPHGARTPGEGNKIFFGVAICIGIAGVLQVVINMMAKSMVLRLMLLRLLSAPPAPRTITSEWQKASNERALEQKIFSC
ncbi:hypothetical protein BDZ89DRAFT_1012465 [Hymenopellis radicata]|nr:hypothetical protein BDZ89DRAFT_1012465 [Hymenopellis radicata]